MFDDPEALLRAATILRTHNYAGLDALTPYPVHGLPEALGLKTSWMPRVTKTAFFIGAGLGFAFQVWVLGWTWRLNIAGKPFVPVPALMPVTFESGILVAGIATFVAMLIAVKLRPTTHYVPFDLALTNDRFALLVPGTAAEMGPIRALLEQLGAAEVRTVAN